MLKHYTTTESGFSDAWSGVHILQEFKEANDNETIHFHVAPILSHDHIFHIVTRDYYAQVIAYTREIAQLSQNVQLVSAH